MASFISIMVTRVICVPARVSTFCLFISGWPFGLISFLTIMNSVAMSVHAHSHTSTDDVPSQSEVSEHLGEVLVCLQGLEREEPGCTTLPS